MKRLLKTTILVSLLVINGCASNKNSTDISKPASSNEVKIENEVQEYFYKLKNNNFSIDYTDNYVNYGIDRNQKFYFTEYSLQTEGAFGFIGYAQDVDETIFRYNIVDGDVLSSAPVINSSTGVRYSSIYELTYGMDKFDISYLENKVDSEGYYTYEFGKNSMNDIIFASVFLYKQISYSGGDDYKVRMKIVQDNLLIEAQMLGYDIYNDGNLVYDTVSSIVYDVGKTENKEIKKYLLDGKSSKKPLDLNFYKLIHPYLFDINYTVDLSSENMTTSNSFRMNEKCTNEAILDTVGSTSEGYLLDNHGIINYFNVTNEKLNILYTPINQQDNTPYYSLYGGILETSFYDLTYDTFIGYIDEDHPNSYIITDPQAIYTLSYICYIQLSDEMACSSLRLEVIDAEKHEFKLYINLYNKILNRNLGYFTAYFYDFGKTVIKPVDRYLAIGENPFEQDISELSSVLNKFKEGNYSCDIVLSSGLGKYYFTPNYYYIEIYGNPNQNMGYLKEDGKIYQFKIVDNKISVDKSKDYYDSMSLPGCGDSYLMGNDLNYFSHFDDRIYDISLYEKHSFIGLNYWKITNSELSSKIFNYVFNHPSQILPMGSGLIVQDGDDPYDVRVSVVSTYYDTRDDSYGGMTFTYYDIGSTSNKIVEDYLNGGN